MRLGTVTIGQSPRSDIMPELLAAVGREVEVIECGALDDLDRREIDELAPVQGDYPLVSRLRDGSEVRLAERHVIERLKNCIRKLERQAIELVILLCTGEFPHLTASCPVLKPDRLLVHVISGITESGTLGVIVPMPQQQEVMKPKWQRTGLDVVSAAASPYSSTEAELAEAARRLKASGATLVVLDCLGFGSQHARIVRRESGLPVLVPRTLLGRIAAELMP